MFSGLPSFGTYLVDKKLREAKLKKETAAKKDTVTETTKSQLLSPKQVREVPRVNDLIGKALDRIGNW